MRIDVQKFLFIGAESSFDAFLKSMQQAGKVQFATKQKMIQDLIGARIYDIFRALKILAHHEEADFFFTQEPHREITIRNPFSFSLEIIHMNEELEAIEIQLKILESQSILSQLFGNIPWDCIHYLQSHSQLHVRFFEGATNRQFDTALLELIPIQENSEKSSFISFLPIQERLPPGLREVHRDELQAIYEKKKALTDKKSSLTEKLKAQSLHKKSLQEALYQESNLVRLEEAKQQCHLEVENRLFSITGWAPENVQNDILEIAAQHNVIAEEIQPAKDEIAPTYLKNRGVARIGEDLVHIYDTPSNSDKDPSLWVLFFFALFFAMIVCDAGYGLIFIGMALLLQRNKKRSSFAKRITKLCMILGISCLSWGLLCHSFFGISFHENSIIKKSSFLTYMVTKKASFHFSQGITDSEIQKWSALHHNKLPRDCNDLLNTPSQKGETFAKRYSGNVLFELSLFIGAIHIILGMVWYIKKQPSYIGWILFLVGAYLYVPFYLDATSLTTYIFGIGQVYAAHLGISLMIWGGSGALIYGIWRDGISGIFECMVAIQIFADILSYLRLYALSLSGALVAEIIIDSTKKMPLVIGFFVLIVAHIINIVLSTVGGIIHGLRLNFLEWYHYAFEGGGKEFTPLRREEIGRDS